MIVGWDRIWGELYYPYVLISECTWPWMHEYKRSYTVEVCWCQAVQQRAVRALYNFFACLIPYPPSPTSYARFCLLLFCTPVKTAHCLSHQNIYTPRWYKMLSCFFALLSVRFIYHVHPPSYPVGFFCAQCTSIQIFQLVKPLLKETNLCDKNETSASQSNLIGPCKRSSKVKLFTDR